MSIAKTKNAKNNRKIKTAHQKKLKSSIASHSKFIFWFLSEKRMKHRTAFNQPTNFTQSLSRQKSFYLFLQIYIYIKRVFCLSFTSHDKQKAKRPPRLKTPLSSGMRPQIPPRLQSPLPSLSFLSASA